MDQDKAFSEGPYAASLKIESKIHEFNEIIYIITICFDGSIFREIVFLVLF